LEVSRTASERITVLCAVKNRTANLITAAGSWLARPEISQIVIVDWGSEDLISELPLFCSNSSIQVVRAEAKGWHLSAALNRGLTEITDGWVLKADADHVLRKAFFSRVRQEQGSFYRGFWADHLPRNAGLNGLCYVPAEDLRTVGGWDERIQTYGWEDTDLYHRLTAVGLRQRFLPLNTASHLTHPKPQERAQRKIHNRTSTEINRRATEARPVWPLDKAGQPRLGPLVDTESRDSFLKARAEVKRYRWLFQVPWEWGHRTLRAMRKVGRRGKKILGLAVEKNLVLVPAHGLGNRLRAIASAQALCLRKDWNLTVVWLKDDHMRAELTDLIEYKGKVISDPDYLLELATSRNVKFQNFVGNNPRVALVRFPWFRNVHVVRSSRSLHNGAKSRLPDLSSLRRYIVTAEVEESCSKLSGESFDLGIHIRTGAEVFKAHSTYEKRSQNWSVGDSELLMRARKASGPQAFLEHLRALEPQISLISKGTALICADLHQAGQEVGEYLTDLGWQVTYGNNESARSKEAVVRALGDAVALSRTGFFIGSHYSAFTDLVVSWRGTGESLAIGNSTKN